MAESPDTRITGYAGTSDKAQRLPGAAAITINKFLNTEYNAINDFLLAVKELRSDYEMDQDLNKTSTVIHAGLILSNFTAANLLAISNASGQLTPITTTALRTLLNIPEDRPVKQAVIAGTNIIEFVTPFSSVSWAFSGIPFIVDSNGEMVLFQTITNVTASGFTIKSPVAGTLHCVAKLIS